MEAAATTVDAGHQLKLYEVRFAGLDGDAAAVAVRYVTGRHQCRRRVCGCRSQLGASAIVGEFESQ